MTRRKTEPPRGVLSTAPAAAERIVHARYHPSADLEPWVEHFWSVRWDMRGLPSHRVETLPHPSVHLIFEDGLGGQVSGITKGKFTRLLSGLGGVFAAKFRPGGFYPFVRTPVAGFADTTLSPGRVWGRDGDALEREVSSQADDDGRMAAIEAFLRARRPQPDEHAALSGKVVETIASDRELRTMDDVARRFGLNPRTLQRLFARYVGVNPKWVIQRYRLHEAAEQLAAGTGSQSALALELGYADQAHFINDFKAIVGVSPAAYARRARPEPDTGPSRPT